MWSGPYAKITYINIIQLSANGYYFFGIFSAKSQFSNHSCCLEKHKRKKEEEKVEEIDPLTLRPRLRRF